MRKLSTLFLTLMLVAAFVFGASAAETQNADQAVAQVVETGVYYTDLSDALQAAAAGQTVRMLKDTQEVIVSVKEDTTLDLGGYTLTATYASVFGYVEDNSAENTGVLKVDEKKLLINTENSQLPVMTDSGFRFVEVVGFNTSWMNENTFVFQPLFEKAGNELLKNGVANTGVSIQVEVTWKPFAGSEDLDSRTFKYGDTLTGQYFGSYNAETGKYGRMFTLSLVNPGNYVDLSCHCKVVSNTRVEFAPEKSDYLTEEVYLTTEQASAIVPAGTKLTDSDVSLGLTTTEMEKTTSDVVLTDGETMLSMDVHVKGVAADNTVPVIVTLNEVTLKGLNEGNIKLYHVENGVTNEMTRVYTIEEVDEHNEYFYDIPTGTITVALKSFSEVAVVADEIAYWKGKIDTSWYNLNPNKEKFEIFNADQLAGFGALVDGGNTFEGKTVTLCMDVYLSDGRHQDIVTNNPDIIPSQMFNPIGYSYSFKGGQVFKGTFDGNGNTIHNMFQQGWDMEATYNNGEDYTNSMAGAGLFASIENATIKNLTMDNAFIAMECVDMGVVVGYANGNCIFENIIVKNSLVANYQRYTGGAIGEVGNGHHILKNVDVEATTTVSSLWGDFDASLGGIIGGKWGHTYTNYAGQNGHKVSVAMDSCDVAAKINAYNDVTSAYQWYSYRRAGMLIGNSEESKTVNGRTEATAPYLTTTNCTVQYGSWVNYHYCEFGSTTSLGARYPWVRVEPGYSCGAFSNVRYGVPTFNGATLDVANHGENQNDCHIEGDGHYIDIPFNQLYGGGQGCYGGNGHVGQGLTVLSQDGIILNPTEKFVSTGVTEINTSTITLGELFSGIDGAEIVGNNIYAFVSPADENSTVKATSVAPRIEGDWQNYTLNLSGKGMAKITINDYYYCKPTTIYVTVVDPMVSLDIDATTLYGVGQELKINSVTANYKFGASEKVTNYVVLDNYDMSFGGKKIITVRYTEFGHTISKTFTITVTEEFSSLVVTPDKDTYFVGGAQPKFTVVAIAPDGTKSEVIPESITGADIETAGIKTVTVTLGNKTATCNINVANLTELDDTDDEHALFWYNTHNFMLGGVNSVKTNKYENYVDKIFTGSNGEKATGFDNTFTYYEHAPSTNNGMATAMGENQYDLTITGALPYTYIGIRCIAGYDANLIGFGYYVDGDTSTLKYSAPMYYSDIVQSQPDYQQFIALGGQYTAEAQTKVALSELGFTEGSTHTVTWVAMFEDGIQHISDWEITMKSSFGSSNYFEDTEKPNVNVIVLSGQSNASGATPITQAEIDKYGNIDYKNVFIQYKNVTVNESGFYTENENGGFEKYSFGISGYRATTYGPEAALAYYLATNPETKDEQWFIVKYAAPGTNLDLHWKQTYMLSDEMMNYVQKCVDELTEGGYDVQIRSLMWMQGENDALAKECAERYAENEQHLVSAFRMKFAKYASNPNPKIPGSGISFIDAGIAPAGKNGNVWIYSDIVNAAKVANAYIWYVPGVVTELSPLYGTVTEGGSWINPNTAGIYNSAFIDTSLMDAQANDPAHYDQQAMEWLGTWFGQYVQHMIGAELPSAPSTDVGTEYTLYFSPNGGSVDEKSRVVVAGNSIALPTPTKAGSKFLGWSDGTTTYAAGTTFTPESDVFFKALWQDKFSVKFNNTSANFSGVVYLHELNDQYNAGTPVIIGAKNVGNSVKHVVITDETGKVWKEICLPAGVEGAWFDFVIPTDDVTFTVTEKAHKVNFADNSNYFTATINMTEMNIGDVIVITLTNTNWRTRTATVTINGTAYKFEIAANGTLDVPWQLNAESDVTITIS